MKDKWDYWLSGIMLGLLLSMIIHLLTVEDKPNPQKRIEFIMIDTANCGDELGEVDTIYWNGIKIFKEI